MMAPPSACTGAMASPSMIALTIAASNGSRFMISAVRKGPTRVVEMKTVRVAIVVGTLVPNIAAQPAPVVGGIQFHVTRAMTANSPVDDTIEYHVVRRASACPSLARVMSSRMDRVTAAGNEIGRAHA